MKYFAVFLIFLSSPQIFAALGDTLSPEQSRSQLKAAANNSVMLKNYSVRESTYDGGSQKEYISAEGKVFAVTWRGRVHADPAKILGKYQNNFKTAQANHLRLHGKRFQKRPVSLKDQDLVFETFGHMGDVRGRAYVPSLVPASVDVKNLP